MLVGHDNDDADDDGDVRFCSEEQVTGAATSLRAPLCSFHCHAHHRHDDCDDDDNDSDVDDNDSDDSDYPKVYKLDDPPRLALALCHKL